jgi:hypothetical protein
MTPIEVNEEKQEQPLQTRRFAAKKYHPEWGIFLGIVGVVAILIGISGGLGGVLGGFLVALTPLAASVYLLRGQGTDAKVALRTPAQPRTTQPRAAQGQTSIFVKIGQLITGLLAEMARREAASKAEAARRQAAYLAQIAERKAAQVTQATIAVRRAVDAGQRGAAVVAYRDLLATAKREYQQEAQARVAEALESIRVDAKTFESPRIGDIPSTAGRGFVEVFRDWIIYGQEAHDVDATTRGDVFIDGSVQVTSAVVPNGNKSRVQTTKVDMRTAQVQFVSSSWAMGVPISPDVANEARLVVAQLAVNVESLKSHGVTAQDIKAMVDVLLNNTGQPPAEKLQQLSNLRYQRLLSDDEFEQAKSKILGIS